MVAQEELQLRNSWRVESFTEPGKFYEVKRIENEWTCTCPSFQKRHMECKHIKRVKENTDINSLPNSKGTKNKIESKGDYEMRTKSGIPLDIAVSGLQKEIRRANVENAVFIVQDLVLAGFIRYAWRRLMIIAAEDCGADPSATILVNACYQNDVASSQNFKNGKSNEGVLISQATVYLARCLKNRINDDIWCYLLEKRKAGAKPEVKDYFIDQHTEKGRKMGRDDDYWFKEASKIENEKGPNPYAKKMEELYYKN